MAQVFHMDSPRFSNISVPQFHQDGVNETVSQAMVPTCKGVSAVIPPHPPPTHTGTHKHTARQHKTHLSGSHCSLELEAGPQLNKDDGGARLP